MSEITKPRGRKPLASGPITLQGWSNWTDTGERFNYVIGDLTIRISRIDAERMVKSLTESLNNPDHLKYAGLLK